MRGIVLVIGLAGCLPEDSFGVSASMTCDGDLDTPVCALGRDQDVTYPAVQHARITLKVERRAHGLNGDDVSVEPAPIDEMEIDILAGDHCDYADQVPCTATTCDVPITHTANGVCAMRIHVISNVSDFAAFGCYVVGAGPNIGSEELLDLLDDCNR